MSQNTDGAPQGSINLASLSVPQLRALQTRLTSELEHLTTSHTKLRAAQAKFRDCVRSINDGVTGDAKKGTDGRDEILVPLTSSLYVKGRLTDREKVLVDVGTGFYVEKVCGDGDMSGDWVGWADNLLLSRLRLRRLRFMMIRSRAWMRTCRSWRRLYRPRARNCALWKRAEDAIRGCSSGCCGLNSTHFAR
ncbi:unnamed protein product, partial [Penicillium nalgiovense]